MTVYDAICKIKHRIAIDGFDGKDSEDLKLAIQALEKQTPAKVIYDEFHSGYRLYKCPVCGMNAIWEWCSGCGQKLDLAEMHEWQKPIIEKLYDDWYGPMPTCYSFIQPKGD